MLMKSFKQFLIETKKIKNIVKTKMKMPNKVDTNAYQMNVSADGSPEQVGNRG